MFLPLLQMANDVPCDFPDGENVRVEGENLVRSAQDCDAAEEEDKELGEVLTLDIYAKLRSIVKIPYSISIRQCPPDVD